MPRLWKKPMKRKNTKGLRPDRPKKDGSKKRYFRNTLNEKIVVEVVGFPRTENPGNSDEPCLGEWSTEIHVPQESLVLVVGKGIVESRGQPVRLIRGKRVISEGLRRLQASYEAEDPETARRVGYLCLGLNGDHAPGGLPIPTHAIDFYSDFDDVSKVSCLIVVRRHEKRSSYEVIPVGTNDIYYYRDEYMNQYTFIGDQARLYIAPVFEGQGGFFHFGPAQRF